MIVTPVETRLGWIALLSDSLGLVRATIPKESWMSALAELHSAHYLADVHIGTNPISELASDRVGRFLSGEIVAFDDIPLSVSGATAFQQTVWRLTSAIRYGETRTYGELAADTGRELAARAIGQCMLRNPLPIFIPCHRVVGRDGKLHGYAGGVALKQALLEMEGAR